MLPIEIKLGETTLTGKISDERARSVVFQLAGEEERKLLKEGLPQEATERLQQRVVEYAGPDNDEAKAITRLLGQLLYRISDDVRSRESFAALVFDIFRGSPSHNYFGKDEAGYWICLDDEDLQKILQVLLLTSFKQMGVEPTTEKVAPKQDNQSEIQQLEAQLAKLKSAHP